MDLAKKLQLDVPPAEPSSGDEALAKLFPAPPVAVAAPPRPFGMSEPGHLPGLCHVGFS